MCVSQKNLLLSLSITIALTVSISVAQDQGSDEKKVPSPTTLMEFDGKESAEAWTAVNDGVMGGLSEGKAQSVRGLLLFSGTLSLENNGGFSSIRMQGESHDLTKAKRMTLRIKGDGRTYQLRLSTDARFRGSRISYGAEFKTKTGEWIEVTVPFATLKPTYRGNTLDGPPLDLSKIEEIGLLIGDKRAGKFSLAVDWIKAS